jgi:hypothetical protein
MEAGLKKLTMRRILEIVGAFLQINDRLKTEVEIRRGKSTATLSKIRPGLNAAGRPTRKTIECLQDGIEKSFDRNVEVEIVDWIVDGKRMSQSDLTD